MSNFLPVSSGPSPEDLESAARTFERLQKVQASLVTGNMTAEHLMMRTDVLFRENVIRVVDQNIEDLDHLMDELDELENQQLDKMAMKLAEEHLEAFLRSQYTSLAKCCNCRHK